tara:strand:- start:120 stop:431 length:312 start_codon:yes stop_codon:yes gene_type:complete
MGGMIAMLAMRSNSRRMLALNLMSIAAHYSPIDLIVSVFKFRQRNRKILVAAANRLNPMSNSVPSLCILTFNSRTDLVNVKSSCLGASIAIAPSFGSAIANAV